MTPIQSVKNSGGRIPSILKKAAVPASIVTSAVTLTAVFDHFIISPPIPTREESVELLAEYHGDTSHDELPRCSSGQEKYFSVTSYSKEIRSSDDSSSLNYEGLLFFSNAERFQPLSLSGTVREPEVAPYIYPLNPKDSLAQTIAIRWIGFIDKARSEISVMAPPKLQAADERLLRMKKTLVESGYVSSSVLRPWERLHHNLSTLLTSFANILATCYILFRCFHINKQNKVLLEEQRKRITKLAEARARFNKVQLKLLIEIILMPLLDRTQRTGEQSRIDKEHLLKPKDSGIVVREKK